MSINLQIAKWGNSLAMRLPSDLVRRFGLREGDRVSLRPRAIRVFQGERLAA